MKFKVRDSANDDVEVELWLENAGDERVYLVGSDGANRRVILIFQNGCFIRALGARIRGLDTVENGRIKEVGEE